jgi:hypothetical protein
MCNGTPPHLSPNRLTAVAFCPPQHFSRYGRNTSGSGAGCYCGWNRWPPLLEARPAEHGATLCGLKGNGGFSGALRTNGPGFGAHAIAGSGYPLNFALFATLWIILELLIVKEQLFAGGEDKVVPAI